VRPRPLLPSLDHLAALSDDTGVIQHALESVPNRSTGYCTDDVARAFVVALSRLRVVPGDEFATRLASTCLSFLHDAQLEDGRFHNFMSYQREWLDDVGTQDSCGRAIWALGFGIQHAPTPAWRRVCRQLLDRAITTVDGFDFPHPRAYAIVGLCHAYAALHEAPYAGAMRFLADTLLAAYERERRPGWNWYTDIMTYDNARLPEAMIRTGHVLGEAKYLQTGLESLRFYEDVTILDGVFVPIGNAGWYRRGGERPIYGQQPLDACAMIDAELAAYEATEDPAHFAYAELGLAWFYGKNSRAETMAHGGGCFDGLEKDAVNRNMGAESTLALLSGAYAMAERQTRTLKAVNR
jgi:uncharacterized protein YyaL (SSP411 family)